MIAEIISVGTELLLGKVANLDAQIISQELAARGIFVLHHTVVGDNDERLREAVHTAKNRADIILTTGGLGPTYDDMTKQTVSACFGRKLVMHQPSLDKIYAYFDALGRKCTPNNEQQAMMPEGCTVLENGMGTAPGCAFDQEGIHVFLLPGPPRECRGMLLGAVVPYLEKLSDTVLVSKFIHFFGIGESAMEYQLREQIEHAVNPSIAPYATDGEAYLRVTATAATRDACEAMLAPVVQDICEQFKPYVYGVDVDSLEEAVSNILHAQGKTLVLAESCTGGKIAERITSLAGASKIFWGGMTVYTNAAKEALLGVPAPLLAQFGAVSHETAVAMAEGAREKSGADYAISVTGLCGPDDLDGVPAGTVYIGVSSEAGTVVKQLDAGRNRRRGQLMASGHALKFLLDIIS